MAKVPYIPFIHTHPEIKQEIADVFEQFYDDQDYILGKGLEQFEKDYAKFNDVKYSIGVGNGHDALLIILKALGIRAGDEVILPAKTFIATALSVKNTGATPVLVDVNKYSFNIDTNLIEEKITEKTKAIVPVHLYGNPCDMDPLESISKKHNLHIIEDNAQAQGAEYKNQKTGSFGIMNFTSFYPTKNLGALGDGGMITTNSEELSNKVRSLRNYGKSMNGSYSELGINSRLDELQARILSVKLRHLKKWNEERIQIASWYERELDGIEVIQLQSVKSQSKSVRHVFPMLSKNRTELKKQLKSKEIDTLIHYEKPIHFHDVFSFLNHKKGSFPIAEKICNQELSLPIYPGLKENQVIYICSEIKNFFNNN